MPTSVQSRESIVQAHASVRDTCAPNRLAPLQLTWSKGGFKPYKLSRNVMQQHFVKKHFAKEWRPGKVGRGLGRLAYGLRRRGSLWLRTNKPTDARVSLHSRERKMASMKIAGLPRVGQHSL